MRSSPGTGRPALEYVGSSLAGGEWIDAQDNLVLCGPTGPVTWCATSLACGSGRRDPVLSPDAGLVDLQVTECRSQDRNHDPPQVGATHEITDRMLAFRAPACLEIVED